VARLGKVRLTDGMRIERLDPSDDTARNDCAAVYDAALDIDDPGGSRMPARVLGAWLRQGFTGDPAEGWIARGTGANGVLGWYRLELPDLENLDRAGLLVVVHPGHRRRGLGRALLRHAAERAAAAGRTVLAGEVRDGSAGDAFAAATGAAPGIAATLRRLDLRALPASRLDELRAAAAAAATGYSLVRWAGPTPAEYLRSLANVLQAYADAPHDAGVEAETWDASRIRERADAPLQAMGLRPYTVGAVHDASGELAAITMVSVAPDSPRWAHQGLTAVTRPHRGHRLGLLVKTAMLDWLAVAEPAVELVETGNASANSHMIGVNDALGFVPSAPAFHTCELAAADAVKD
jgi:GNAT superfamily N-acetyltransferase